MKPTGSKIKALLITTTLALSVAPCASHAGAPQLKVTIAKSNFGMKDNFLDRKKIFQPIQDQMNFSAGLPGLYQDPTGPFTCLQGAVTEDSSIVYTDQSGKKVPLEVGGSVAEADFVSAMTDVFVAHVDEICQGDATNFKPAIFAALHQTGYGCLTYLGFLPSDNGVSEAPGTHEPAWDALWKLAQVSCVPEPVVNTPSPPSSGGGVVPTNPTPTNPGSPTIPATPSAPTIGSSLPSDPSPETGDAGEIMDEGVGSDKVAAAEPASTVGANPSVEMAGGSCTLMAEGANPGDSMILGGLILGLSLIRRNWFFSKEKSWRNR